MNKQVLSIILVIVVVTLGATLYGFLQVEEELVGPQITIDPTSYDLGRVKFGDVPEYTFTVKNSGDQPLQINGVTTSCACTKGEIDQEEILPGQEAGLLVSFDPAVHGDDTDMGKLTRTVYIATNDPINKEVEVKIYADVYK
ncbi:DUF1573 domain-containing protein [Patescibacteria group bacterium]|nr:DUF1573 domain-containing protein [Patescibacteria group bacterium]MBU1951880.1 DUF1573 domain-containing protein [Patescibacteria group bacterium]